MSELRASSYVDACLSGLAFVEDVDDWVDEWHESGGQPRGEAIALSTFLGMSTDEYGLWVEQPSALRFIVAAHRRGAPVVDVMTTQRDYALAARAEDPDAAKEVLMWLIASGRVDPERASHA